MTKHCVDDLNDEQLREWEAQSSPTTDHIDHDDSFIPKDDHDIFSNHEEQEAHNDDLEASFCLGDYPF